MTDDAEDKPKTDADAENSANEAAAVDGPPADAVDEVSTEEGGAIDDGPSLLERRFGRLSWAGALRSILVATVLGTIILAGLVLRPDPLQKSPAPVQPREQDVDLGLGFNELTKAARGALAQGDRAAARAAYEAAMAKLGDSQVKERLEVCEALAMIADEDGRELDANAYREFAAQLRRRLATAVIVFGQAEDALREKRYDEALRLYRRFLLRSDELPEDQRDFVERARQRIALLWQQRLGDAGALATKIDFEPEVWFDGR